MSSREITAFNLGRDNWEDVIRYGADAALDIVLARPLTQGAVYDALDNLGRPTFLRWFLRGAQETATGADP